MTVNERISSFKNDLMKGNLTYEEILQKYIVDGTSYFFHDYIKNVSAEDKLKVLISKSFSVDTEEVIIVGSGKLGFSLSPTNYFSEFDKLFSITRLNRHKSDLDVAIISTKLYNEIGEKMYHFTAAYENKWHKSEFYSIERARQLFPVPVCYKYFEYITKGWFRPDFRPLGFEFCINGRYEELKGAIYRYTKRKVGIAIYQNRFYFTNYHLENIKRLSLKLKTEKL